MSMIHRPASEAGIADLIRRAAEAGQRLGIRGGGTRAGLGRPIASDITLDMGALSGITLHEPAEMVISALAGTPLRTVEETLLAKGQMLPFEPMDHRAIYGMAGEPSIGAVVAANLSGPRRVVAGACRDHLIGLRFVNGMGEIIRSGGRVMKNVTGLDLVKLQAGAHGTLGVLTEVTFKVLPRLETTATMLFEGFDDRTAVAVMSAALGSPFEVTGAAYLPAGISAGPARTLLRFENFSASIEYRFKALAETLKKFGAPHRMDGAESERLWSDIRDCTFLAEPREPALWRLSLKPSEAPGLIEALHAALPGMRHFLDWGGGLIWLATAPTEDAGAAIIRAAIQGKGHATLVRAPDSIRASVPVFEPESAPVAALSQRIKSSFDPAGLINPGRMVEGV